MQVAVMVAVTDPAFRASLGVRGLTNGSCKVSNTLVIVTPCATAVLESLSFEQCLNVLLQRLEALLQAVTPLSITANDAGPLVQAGCLTLLCRKANSIS